MVTARKPLAQHPDVAFLAFITLKEKLFWWRYVDGVMTERMSNNISPSLGTSTIRNIPAEICFTGSDHLHHWKLVRTS